MRLYSISEVFGPVKCEINKCGKEAWTFMLSKYEDSILVINRGPEATQQIFQQSLGTAMCEHHLDLLFERKKKDPTITVEDVKNRDFKKIDGEMDKAKDLVFETNKKHITNLFIRRCGCGREMRFTDEGLKVIGMDGIILVNGSIEVKCVCNHFMSASFSYLVNGKEHNEKLRIKADGKLGVANPSIQLHIADTKREKRIQGITGIM